jgi:serine protease Do
MKIMLKKIIQVSILFIFTFNLSSANNSNLPDFTKLVDNNSASIVNISTVRKSQTKSANSNPQLPNDELNEFLKKFFGDKGFDDPDKRIPRKSQSMGSGFIYSSDGYIITNHHVIADADQIIVKLNDKRELDAKLIGSDPSSDIALLKIKAKNLKPVKVGNSENLKVGQWVLAIGSPFGFESTVTAGIVSAIGRSLPNDNYVPFIQTDVAINPGNSGGPLFNLSGEVIGVNAQIYSRTGGFMGVSFAIPSDTVNDVYYQLKTKGKVSRGWLGVYIQEIDDKLAKSFGMKKSKGALVSKVLSNSPAEKAKIQQGDVILKFNNNDINKSTDLPLVVGQSKVGKSFNVQIMRNRMIMNLSVTLEELPTEEKIASIGSGNKKIISNAISGISVRDMSIDDKKNFDLSSGVVVTGINESINNNYDLKLNDVITKINNKIINNANDFTKIMKSASNNSYVNLLVYRQATPLFIALKISK